MNNNYTIRNLFALLMSKIWIIVVFTILVGAASFGISKFIIPMKYESYTTMYVKNNNTVNSEQNNNVDLNDLNASKSLVSTYIAVLKSNAVMEQVGFKLTELYNENDLSLIFNINNGKISTDDIKECFSMSAVDETEVMRISVNTKSPEISADMCNIIAEIAPNFLIRVVGAGSVEIIDTAVPDKIPVSPNVSLITIIGAVVGLSISIFIILLIDFFDNTVKETEELTQRFDKAILGKIQSIETKKKKSKTDSIKLITDKNISFNVVESYKSIRTNILFALGTCNKKIFAVSSPNPSEGKSTMAANIAIALAQTGSTVLLIDADMRKPVQHKTFKIKNSNGLSTLIINKSSIAKSVRRNIVKCLDLLPSGPIPPNPSELLASEKFGELLEKFSVDYDYIIIDTPPINVVSDALVIKNLISGILIVLKYASTTFDDVSSCMKQIDLAKTNMLGFVLNDICCNCGSLYYNYKYKYNDYSYVSASDVSSSGKADAE